MVSGMSNWRLAPDPRVLVLGHSNGGQGAWYLAARFPDRVVGGAPLPSLLLIASAGVLIVGNTERSGPCSCIHQGAGVCAADAVEVSRVRTACVRR